MKKGFLGEVVKGATIGAVGIIPGASGGVIAVCMGVYKPMLDAVYGFFTDFRKSAKRHFLYLLPLGIGAVAGIYGCGLLLEWLLAHYELHLMYALLGLMLGGVPSLLKEANQFGFKPSYLWGTLLGMALIVGFFLLDGGLTTSIVWPWNGWTAFLAGAMIMAGMMIPGMSTSFLLMYLGLYAPLLNALTSLNIPMLFCVGMGALVVGAAMLYFVRKVFQKHHGYTYYSVFGFLLGTLVLIFPGFSSGYLVVLDIALAALSFGLSYWLTKSAQ